LLAIRELFDAYAHCADQRDVKGQMALFIEDTHFVVYMDARLDRHPAVRWLTFGRARQTGAQRRLRRTNPTSQPDRTNRVRPD
jgi:hypothetical protein